MSSPFRTAEGGSLRTTTGGRIDRDTTLRFTFDGEAFTGHPGDTLASALLAVGRHQIATSIKLGRPRGIAAAWAEDPGGLVQVEEPFPEPMLLATTIELYDGLAARGLPGQGRLADVPDSARYDAVHQHVDVLVVGAGPAGLAAALSAARAGVRVALVDEQSEAGGSLLSGTDELDGAPAADWVAAAVAELAARPDVLHLQRTTAFGSYDDGFGRSDSRAKLRHFFEVNRYFVAIAALKALADQGEIKPKTVSDAIKKYGIDPEKADPTTV